MAEREGFEPSMGSAGEEAAAEGTT